MDSDNPEVEELLADYRETCRLEGALSGRLRKVKMDKARQMAEINHAIGEIGQYDRDRQVFGEEHAEQQEYGRSMRGAAEEL